MKKLLSGLSAVIIALSASLPFGANAEYTPTFYFVPHNEAYSDNTITLSKSDIADGLSITVDVFVDDESLTCWSVDPKWKSSTSYITLANELDPQDPFIPYAYAEEKNGELSRVRHTVSIGSDEDCNTMFFSCDIGFSMNRSPLTPYGEKTDDYALTSFDLVFSPDIPVGEYSLYFLTEAEDYPDQRKSEVAVRTDDGSKVLNPITKNISIKITDMDFGDVNSDGLVDANDATIVLGAYALSSTGFDSGLTPEEKKLADVNHDGLVDANDASAILDYYSYVSTGGTLGIEEYLEQ